MQKQIFFSFSEIKTQTMNTQKSKEIKFGMKEKKREQF